MSGYWLKVTAVLPSPPEDWSCWHEAFAQHGPNGTVQEEARPSISAYLAPGAYEELGPLVRTLVSRGAVRVETEICPEDDWSQAWKQYFQPVEVGKRFVVTPSWKECELDTERTSIVLDPGQAFGTGGHATTRMCLALLESAMEGREAGPRVLDVGCGSGILSIAAAMMGGKVRGIDTDPICVEASQENAERNGVAAEFELSEGGLGEPSEAYDLVVSNIVADTLIELAPEVREVLTHGGAWVVGGIIHERMDEIAQTAES
ncbi:MAG: 50S ribosomal protein L11 methyltransferase, partial [Fimbriimonadaceae bacterium]